MRKYFSVLLIFIVLLTTGCVGETLELIDLISAEKMELLTQFDTFDQEDFFISYEMYNSVKISGATVSVQMNFDYYMNVKNRSQIIEYGNANITISSGRTTMVCALEVYADGEFLYVTSQTKKYTGENRVEDNVVAKEKIEIISPEIDDEQGTSFMLLGFLQSKNNGLGENDELFPMFLEAIEVY